MSGVKIKFNKNFKIKYDKAINKALLESGRKYVEVAQNNIETLKHNVVYARALRNHPIYSNGIPRTSGVHGGIKHGLVDSGKYLKSIDTSPEDGIFAIVGKKLIIGSNVDYARELEDKYTEVEGKFGVLEGSLYESTSIIRKTFLSVFKKFS